MARNDADLLDITFSNFHLTGSVPLEDREVLRVVISPPPYSGKPRARSPPATVGGSPSCKTQWVSTWQPAWSLPVPALCVGSRTSNVASSYAREESNVPGASGVRVPPSMRTRSPSDFRSFRGRGLLGIDDSVGGRLSLRQTDHSSSALAESERCFKLELVVSRKRSLFGMSRMKRSSAAKADRVVAHTYVDLRTIATGPVHHSLVLQPLLGSSRRLLQSSVCLSFDARCAHERDVVISLSDVSVDLNRVVAAPYLVAVFQRGTEEEFAEVANIATVPATETRSRRAGSAAFRGRALDGGHIASSTDVVVRVEPKAFTSTPNWEKMPDLVLQSCGVAELVHGHLLLKVQDAHLGMNTVVATSVIPFHAIWGCSSFTSEMENIATMTGRICKEGVPSTAQMILNGVHTDYGIFGARPVIFGTPLPSIRGPLSSGIAPRNSAIGEPLHPDWYELVDSFSYTYWHRRNRTGTVCDGDADENSWIRPSVSGVVDDDTLELRREFDLERVSNYRFISLVNGTETWIHPRAAHLTGIPQPRQPVRQSKSDCAQKVCVVKVANRKEISSQSELDGLVSSNYSGGVLIPTAVPPWSSGERLESVFSEDGFVTEMKWSKLETRNWVPGTEGQTLTSHDDRTVLQFGGATFDTTKLNSVLCFDPTSLRWSERPAVGAIPESRVGHASIAIGANLSRMLVFGGTSKQGRLNDVHVFDIGRDAWSPVSYSGRGPAPRARHGMALWRDCGLVFGGREGYLFLHDRYFDDIHCFNAARSEWLRFVPQGCQGGPSARSGAAVEVINERLLFVHGGYDERKYFNDTWLFDTVSFTWQRPPYDDPSIVLPPREALASSVVQGVVAVYGGEGESNGYCGDLVMFNTDQLRWAGSPTTHGHSPGPRSGGSMVAVDDSHFLFAGGTTGFNHPMGVFVLDTHFISKRDIEESRSRAVERGFDSNLCVICMSRPPAVVYAFCGHSVTCLACDRRGTLATCPLCRQEVVKSVPLAA